MPSASLCCPYPSTAPALLWLAFQRAPRSFRNDAQRLVNRLSPPLRVDGAIPDISGGSWLVVVNHYTRPGIRSWWFSMAISSTFPREVRGITTSALTFLDGLRAAIGQGALPRVESARILISTHAIRSCSAEANHVAPAGSLPRSLLAPPCFRLQPAGGHP